MHLVAAADLARIASDYMNNTEICKSRHIAPFAIRTPLLVPSFSSRSDMDLPYMFGLTNPYILRAVLLSAYDMFHKQVNEREIYISDVVFIDSGGYEARNVDDLGIGFSPNYQPKPWSLEKSPLPMGTVRELLSGAA